MVTKGDLTREKILEAARYLFNTKGFGASSINDLVDASGLQKVAYISISPARMPLA